MNKIGYTNLYLVISEECALGRSAVDAARAAIEGGVDMIQMREKNKPRAELERPGKEIAKLCKDKQTTFIVNDDPALAMEIGADGVHLGQEDLINYPVKETRIILGPDKIIGLSTHSIAEFAASNETDADYIAFGPIFPTKTKSYFLGTKDVEYVIKTARKPVFFIGGINLSNINELLEKGARNIALTRGITEAEDIESKTREFKDKLGV